ncbi:hypothetical protein [uncultured Tateyamaria sp.]|uniref:hypothetical protein n=1 Tax=uncultured Tateyamaria sp. TaxID=455651 RepID=UPI002607AC39|nr:hypothetical protein [uncultured Tateyamaria sp.]
METQDSIQARAARVQGALAAAFGVRAKSLEVALRRTGRRLPKRLHAEAKKIVAAQSFGAHPRLMRQVDGAALSLAEDRIVGFLSGIDRADRRKGMWLGITAAVVFNILLVFTAVIVWMWWTGQI